MIVDYNFYRTEYGGESIDTESAFVRYERQAENKLGLMTYGNIVYYNGQYGTEQGGQFEAYTDAELAQLQFGVCALIDCLKTFDDVQDGALQVTMGTANGAVKSRTSGGESISYDVQETEYSKAMTDPEEKEKLLKRTVCSFINLHIFKYNPFYAGLNGRWS